MKHYILSSSEFEGEVHFVYDFNGLLKQFKDESHMSEFQRKYLLTHLPRTLSELDSWKTRSKTAKFKEIVYEVTFEMFWEKYNYKVGKLKAKAYFEKLSLLDRIKAYEYIERYKNKKKLEGTAMLYAERYIKNRIWEDELM